MTERSEFIAQVDLRQPAQEVDNFRSKIRRDIGEETTQALDNLDAGSQKASKAIGALGFAMAGAEGPTAGMLRNVSDLAMILSTGGLAALVTGLAFAWGTLSKYLDENEARQKALRETTKSMHQAIEDAAKRAVDPLKQSLKELTAELENYGKTARQVKVDEAAFETELLRRRRANLEASLDLQRAQLQEEAERQTLIARTGTRAQLIEAIKDGVVLQAVVSATEKRLAATSKALTEAEETLAGLDAANKALGARDAAKAAAKAGGGGDGGPVDADLEGAAKRWREEDRKEWARTQEERRRQDAELLKDVFDSVWAEVDAVKDAEAEKRQAMLETAELIDQLTYRELEQKQAALQQIRDAYKATYMDAVQGAVGAATASVQQYLDGLITGEERAGEKALAAFLRNMGGQLVGLGTRAVFEGAIISANPLTPGAGIPLSLIGAAAIIAGMGMGAGGTALAHTAAGGQVGRSLPSGGASAVTDRGAPIERSRGGGGGPTSITIVQQWGVAGPHAEDSARAVRRSMRLADRRRYA